LDISTVDPAEIDLTVNAKPFVPNRRDRRRIVKAQRPFYKKAVKKILRERAAEAVARGTIELRGEGTEIVTDDLPVIAHEMGITRPLTQHERVVLNRYGIDPRTIAHDGDAEEVRANA